jgi:hypothetical protein
MKVCRGYCREEKDESKFRLRTNNRRALFCKECEDRMQDERKVALKKIENKLAGIQEPLDELMNACMAMGSYKANAFRNTKYLGANHEKTKKCWRNYYFFADKATKLEKMIKEKHWKEPLILKKENKEKAQLLIHQAVNVSIKALKDAKP